MKRNSRIPLVILFLVAFAVALTCRSLAYRHSAIFSNYYKAIYAPKLSHTLNDSIFREAAIDDSASELKSEVDELIRGKLVSTGAKKYQFITLWHANSRRSGPATRLRLSTVTDQFKSQELFRKFQQLLRDWFNNHNRFQPSVMSELLESIKNPIDRHYGHNSNYQRYSNCAVVGNSGILLNSNHGELIDSHDVVICLNNALIQGYDHHVGTKTSLSFINSNILHMCALRDRCNCHPYGDSIPIIFYVCQPAHLLEYIVCNSSHAAPLLVTDARFDALCARLVKYYSVKSFVEETGKDPTMWGKFHDEKMFHYSSGMQAIMLAVGMCDKVSVFGFGKSENAKHHYHTNQKSELGLHDYEAEYELYKDLAERPEIIPFINEAGIKLPPVIFYR